MTSMELLNSLNSIRDRYILEAKDIGNKGKSRNILPSSGPAAEPLPFSAEKTSRRYQTKDSTKRKKNGLKRLLVLSHLPEEGQLLGGGQIILKLS